MPTGYLQVRVSNARAILPLKDASVAVTSSVGNEEYLSKFITTDENGLTQKIAIELPNNLPIDKPFITLDIRISHPLFYNILIQGVQIFADTLSLKEAMMIPFIENPNPLQTEEFTVIPQDLQFERR